MVLPENRPAKHLQEPKVMEICLIATFETLYFENLLKNRIYSF